jgi:hypothetical protein
MAGRLVTVSTHIPPSITLEPDTRPPVPVVEIDDVRNGQLVGRLSNQARLFVGTDVVTGDQSGRFTVPFARITPITRLEIPADMHFVAASGGKNYYAVTNPRAERLVPSHRVYFQTAERAEAQGYVSAE